MTIEDIFNNDWFIGIIGGIISGIIVFYITKYLLERKNKKDYIKRIAQANKAIGNYIRGYVVEIDFPSNSVIESVKNATAREYDVKVEELNSLKIICEDLIQEIIGNVYVSNENKKLYIEKLEQYVKESDSEEFDLPPEPIKGNFSRTIDAILSGILALVASIIAGIVFDLIM